MSAALEYLLQVVKNDAQTTVSADGLASAVETVEAWLDGGGELDGVVSPPLRVRAGEHLFDLAPDAPADGQIGAVFSVPDDMLNIRSIFVDTRPLDKPKWIDFTDFRLLRDSANYLQPVFSQVGKKIHVMPAPDKLEFLAYSKIPSLNDNETNYVFDDHKRIYSHGIISLIAFRRRSMTLAGSRFNSFVGAVQNANMTFGSSVFAEASAVSRPIAPPGR